MYGLRPTYGEQQNDVVGPLGGEPTSTTTFIIYKLCTNLLGYSAIKLKPEKGTTTIKTKYSLSEAFNSKEVPLPELTSQTTAHSQTTAWHWRWHSQGTGAAQATHNLARAAAALPLWPGNQCVALQS